EVLDILKGEGFGNPRDLLPKITAPALILKAEAKEENHRKRHLEAGSLLPNGKLIHIEGAGHVIRKDKPNETEAAIRAFLKTIKP
ncbi:MAG: alpha/beta hydrolase, partial [Bacteroidales bacterium]|nr:alpha/beta hydrolase [Bacteroidales bacterium]